MIPIYLFQRFECSDGCIDDMMLPMGFPAMLPVGSDVHVSLQGDILELSIKAYRLLASGHLQVECRALVGNEFMPLDGTVAEARQSLFDAGFQTFDGRVMRSAHGRCREKPALAILRSM